MKLFEEFKEYENMWNSLNDSQEPKLLWINPDGIEIDLSDPDAFQKELDKEKKRYQHYLQQRLLTDDIVYSRMPPSQKGRAILAQKLKDRAEQKGTSFATELEQTIYKHMEAYKGKLKKEKDRLATVASSGEKTNKIWYHKTTAYDMSTEDGAIAYINRMAVNHLGGSHTPERLKARLVQLKQEILPKLEDMGYLDIVKKLELHINNLITILAHGDIPKELQQVEKRPSLIKQVRNKNYDISNKYAFGTYLSYSYRDMLKQNPNMSEDEVRKVICNEVIDDLKNEPVNPTTTTAIKQLEAIIDSPIEFYNFIHAKRLSSKRSAEKRIQKQMQAELYDL